MDTLTDELKNINDEINDVIEVLIDKWNYSELWVEISLEDEYLKLLEVSKKLTSLQSRWYRRWITAEQVSNIKAHIRSICDYHKVRTIDFKRLNWIDPWWSSPKSTEVDIWSILKWKYLLPTYWEMKPFLKYKKPRD